MKFYVSIISHGHYEFISKNSDLLDILKLSDTVVIVKDNIEEPLLASFCHDNGILYLANPQGLGFGENNNYVYEYCRAQLNMSANDFFLTLNPDVIISGDMFSEMVNMVQCSSFEIFTIDLYKDKAFKISEPSLRFFPTWKDLFNLIVNKPVCSAYSKENISNYAQVEWASGAFLGFKSSLYQSLQGFDSRYFMYYEDVDICYRARHRFGAGVHFLKDIRAVHFGAYQNRKIFSKHFRWYITSLIKFMLRTLTFGK